MKRITSFIFLISLLMVVTVTATGQKVDFQGTWKLDRTKSTLPANKPTLKGEVAKKFRSEERNYIKNYKLTVVKQDQKVSNWF